MADAGPGPGTGEGVGYDRSRWQRLRSAGPGLWPSLTGVVFGAGVWVFGGEGSHWLAWVSFAFAAVFILWTLRCALR